MAIKFWKILKMVKSSVQATASLGVAGKTTGGFRKKKKKKKTKVQEIKMEGLLPIFGF